MLSLAAWLLSICGAPASLAQTQAKTTQAETTQAQPEAQRKPRLNVLENGDFEALDEDLAPSGWNSAFASSLRFVEGEDDNRFVQIEARGDDGARRIFRRLALDPKWKTLRFSARLKGSGLQMGDKPWRDAHIVATFYDEAGQVLKFTRPVALLSGSQWKKCAGQEAIPPGSRQCEIEIANYAQAGVLAIDDVAIEPDGLMEAPPLRADFPEGRFEILEPANPAEQIAEQPIGWPIAGVAGLELEEEGGNHFLRFSNADPEGHVRVESIWQLERRGGRGARLLRVSARMRVRELRKGQEFWQTARIGLGFTDALGVNDEHWPPALMLEADSGWRTVSTTFSVPQSARFLKVTPELMQATGVLDVDDIQVQQMF